MILISYKFSSEASKWEQFICQLKEKQFEHWNTIPCMGNRLEINDY